MTAPNLPPLSRMSHMRLLSALLLTLFAGAFSAKVDRDWSIGWVNDVNPDGMCKRRAIGINGEFPPKPLVVNSDDFVRINVTNQFGDGRPTTLHGHGLLYKNISYYDGAASISQCPIPDGQTFSYELINSPKSGDKKYTQHGTYWLHSHYKGQYVDGLRTPFIIHNSHGEAYDYDDDYTVVLGDWYHAEHGYILHNVYLKPNGSYPAPASGLFYYAHTKANQEPKNLPGFNENATLHFEPGKTYRLRLINVSGASTFNFWIEGHDLEIIEADGVDVERYPTKFVEVGIGQRYSILVKARESRDHDWTVHVNLKRNMYGRIGDLKLNYTSKVSYGKKNAKRGNGLKTINETGVFDDLKLVPLDKKRMEEPDMSVNLHVSGKKMPDGTVRLGFNDKTFTKLLTPSLFTMMTEPNAISLNPEAYGINSSAVVARYNNMVELTIVNDDDDVHPFHMHGTKFQLVHRSLDFHSTDKAKNPPLIEGQSNPMRRDTVSVPSGGSMSIRFRADNPGAWLMHCHMDWHLQAGLAMVMIQAPEEAKDVLELPSYATKQCKDMNMSVSGNAGGVRNNTLNFGKLE